MKLFLCGGGCGEQTAAANRVFNAYIDHEKPLLYIPLAMGERDHTYDECYEWIQGELAEVKVPSIDMVRSYEELAAKNLPDYGSIFIGGGNTFELLKGMKDSGAFAKMEEYIRNDGVVMGGSAGAIIFGKDIMTAIAMDPNDVALEDTAGFNALDDCSIFPHYTNEWTPEAHVRFTEFIEKYTSEKEAVYALPEEDTIFINGDQVQVIGDRPYYFFESGTGEKKRAELRLELSDNEWPLEYIDHDRPIARAIVFDDDGYFYFMRAHRQDDFGHATIIETSGGGVEKGENPDTAILRELSEELGAEVDVICKIGVVSDYYNLIHRHNLNNYYLCKVKSFGEKHLMPDEIDVFHLSTLKLTFDEAVAEYERRKDTQIGRLIASRELPVLQRAKEIIDSLAAGNKDE